MKKNWFILCIVIFGCNNSSKEKNLKDNVLDDTSIEVVANNEDSFKKPNYDQLNIIEEKLQESYDLIYFSEKNSDFETAKRISSLIILDSLSNENSPTINNVFQIGNLEIINDSISHINFGYTIKQKNSKKTDTLKAIIKKRNLIIEGQIKTAIKIDFVKDKD